MIARFLLQAAPAVLTPPTPLQRFADRMRMLADSTSEGALTFGSALLLVLAGVLIAWLLGSLARVVLRAVGFNRAARNLFLEGPLEGHEPAVVAGIAVRWFLIAGAMVLAVDVLGYDLSGALAARLTEVTPRVLAAALLLVGGSFAAIVIGALTRRFFSTAGVRGARVRGQVVTSIFTFFAVVVALEQLGFAAQFVLALGLIVAGAAGLGVALAFGLGCRELARDFVVEYLRTLEHRDPGEP